MTSPAATMQQVLANLERLADCKLEGPRTLASALDHVAAGIACSLDGYPQAKPWIFQVTIGRLALGKFLRDGRMRHDLAAVIPGVAEQHDVAFDVALERLRVQWARFEAHQGPMAPHFAYGPVDKAQYAAVHAMHLRDHLGAVWEEVVGA